MHFISSSFCGSYTNLIFVCLSNIKLVESAYTHISHLITQNVIMTYQNYNLKYPLNIMTCHN